MEWRSIASVPPTDAATPVLLSDGARFAAGYRAFRVEDDWKYLGYDEGIRNEWGPVIGPRFLERVPNPNAGKRHEWWQMFGCSAFDDDVEVTDEEGRPMYFEPTHWAPNLQKP